MVTHVFVFDNSNLSQEIFAIDTWRAVIYSLGHGHKHMLAILLTIWRPGFREHSCLIRAWLSYNAIFYKTFVSISVKQNFFVSVFVHKCLMMLNNVEYTTLKMFVTQMRNYLFVISFQ